MKSLEEALEKVLSYRDAAHSYTVMPPGRGGRPHLPYRPEVVALFQDLGELLRHWTPRSRSYAETSLALREDHSAIAAAGPAEIKALLTYLWRGESFSDGFWGASLQSGLVAAALNRLHALHVAGRIKAVDPRAQRPPRRIG